MIYIVMVLFCLWVIISFAPGYIIAFKYLKNGASINRSALMGASYTLVFLVLSQTIYFFINNKTDISFFILLLCLNIMVSMSSFISYRTMILSYLKIKTIGTTEKNGDDSEQ